MTTINKINKTVSILLKGYYEFRTTAVYLEMFAVMSVLIKRIGETHLFH